MNNSLPQLLQNKDLDRLRVYRDNLDFYNGVQWTERPGRHDRRLAFNYARVFIDKIASYLMSDISFAVESHDDTPEEKEKG